MPKIILNGVEGNLNPTTRNLLDWSNLNFFYSKSNFCKKELGILITKGHENKLAIELRRYF